jgi:hypothetical protein
MSKLQASFLFSLLLLSALFFIWPVPNTIALRYALFGTNLILLSYLAPGAEWRNWRIAPTWLALLYAAFTAWLLIGAVFVSAETHWSLGEIQGQWGMASLALLIGLLAGRHTLRQSGQAQKILITLLLIVLFMHVLYVDYSGVAPLFQRQAFTKRLSGLTEGPDKSSYLTNLLMTLLLAELLLRVSYKRRLLAMPNAILGLMFALTLVSTYLEDVRNAVISLTLVLLLTFLVYVRTRFAKVRRITFAATTVLALASIVLFLFVSLKADSRWGSLLETIPIALDTKTNKAWLMDSVNLPKLANGRPVDPSNYLRIAFAKEGLLLVRENPLGLGYGRNAFAHGIHAKYGDGYIGHSHSGLIDLAIGAGVPGVLLWLVWMGAWLRFGLRAYFRQASFAGLALALVLFEFNMRMVLDSISRDHSLQQFLFLAGLLTALALAETKAALSIAQQGEVAQ